ncbi:MAG: JAB domain-containing protein [Caldilineaceae bacterium]
MYLRKETPSEYQTSLPSPEPLSIVEYAHNLSSYSFTAPGGSEQRAIRFLHELTVPLQIQTPADVANYVMNEVYYPWSACTQEEMFGLALNTRNCITHNYLVHRGSIDTIPIRIADVFRPAVILNARSVIVSHNHPSSDPEPSPEDVRVTQMMVEAGRLLDVEVLDHLIIAKDRFVSMRDRGVGFC